MIGHPLLANQIDRFKMSKNVPTNQKTQYYKEADVEWLGNLHPDRLYEIKQDEKIHLNLLIWPAMFLFKTSGDIRINRKEEEVLDGWIWKKSGWKDSRKGSIRTDYFEKFDCTEYSGQSFQVGEVLRLKRKLIYCYSTETNESRFCVAYSASIVNGGKNVLESKIDYDKIRFNEISKKASIHGNQDEQNEKEFRKISLTTRMEIFNLFDQGNSAAQVLQILTNKLKFTDNTVSIDLPTINQIKYIQTHHYQTTLSTDAWLEHLRMSVDREYGSTVQSTMINRRDGRNTLEIVIASTPLVNLLCLLPLKTITQYDTTFQTVRDMFLSTFVVQMECFETSTGSEPIQPLYFLLHTTKHEGAHEVGFNFLNRHASNMMNDKMLALDGELGLKNAYLNIFNFKTIHDVPTCQLHLRKKLNRFGLDSPNGKKHGFTENLMFLIGNFIFGTDNTKSLLHLELEEFHRESKVVLVAIKNFMILGEYSHEAITCMCDYVKDHMFHDIEHRIIMVKRKYGLPCDFDFDTNAVEAANKVIISCILPANGTIIDPITFDSRGGDYLDSCLKNILASLCGQGKYQLKTKYKDLYKLTVPSISRREFALMKKIRFDKMIPLFNLEEALSMPDLIPVDSWEDITLDYNSVSPECKSNMEKLNDLTKIHPGKCFELVRDAQALLDQKDITPKNSNVKFSVLLAEKRNRYYFTGQLGNPIKKKVSKKKKQTLENKSDSIEVRMGKCSVKCNCPDYTMKRVCKHVVACSIFEDHWNPIKLCCKRRGVIPALLFKTDVVGSDGTRSGHKGPKKRIRRVNVTASEYYLKDISIGQILDLATDDDMIRLLEGSYDLTDDDGVTTQEDTDSSDESDSDISDDEKIQDEKDGNSMDGFSCTFGNSSDSEDETASPIMNNQPTFPNVGQNSREDPIIMEAQTTAQTFQIVESDLPNLKKISIDNHRWVVTEKRSRRGTQDGIGAEKKKPKESK